MGSEWRLFELNDLSKEITVGFVGSMTQEYVDSGVPFLRSKNIVEHSINWNDIRFISSEFHEKLKKSALCPGDVAIVRTGKPGVTCVIPETLSVANCSDLVIVRVDESRLNPYFLSYFMNSVAAGQQVNSHVVGAVQQHFNVGSAKKIKLLLPSIWEQQLIVNVLRNLDNKITLNRQLNQTLEQMAQVLFKSWFVDYDPIIDNALAAGNTIPDELQDRAERRQLQLAKADHQPLPENIRQLFPSEFELTESLGWVPKGWSVKKFADVTVDLRRGISPKYIDCDGVLVLNQKCIRDHDVNFSLGRRHDSTSKSIDGRALKLGDLLINSTGVGTLGRVAQIKYLQEETVVDSHVTVVRVDPKIYPAYTFAQQIIAIEPEVEAMGEGSTGQTELSRKVLSEKNILLPGSEILKISEKHFIGYAMKSAANIQSTEALAKLRDTLLPKLISGELRIPDAQAQLEEELGEWADAVSANIAHTAKPKRKGKALIVNSGETLWKIKTQ